MTTGNRTEKQLHAFVNGRVQLVGFRYFVIEQAAGLGLKGWVRNAEDGSVEVVAEGFESSLREFEAALGKGPRHAVVDSVETEWSDRLDGFRDFKMIE